jgi:hypothetical protein
MGYYWIIDQTTTLVSDWLTVPSLHARKNPYPNDSKYTVLLDADDDDDASHCRKYSEVFICSSKSKKSEQID